MVLKMKRIMWIILALIVGLGLFAGCENMTPVEPEAVNDDPLEPTDPWVELDLDEVLINIDVSQGLFLQ